MKKNESDIRKLAELKKRLSGEEETISIPVEMALEICRFCEDQAVYDKLSRYGDFYYALKKMLEQKELRREICESWKSFR